MDAINQEVIIPVAGMLLAAISMLFPIAIVFIVMHFRQRHTQQLHETIKHLADKGLPVPPELLDPPRRDRVSDSARFRAITLLGVGVGLGVMFYLLNLKFLIGVGALLLCIGIAQLIALRFEKPDAGTR